MMTGRGVHRIGRRRTRARGLGACAMVLTAAIIAGCASQGMPPGGPPDTAPPTLVKVTPESGSVRVNLRVVDFQFDEIVSERPRGAQSLDQLVLISPSDGRPSVAWGRDRLVVRPQHGWRPNTAYTVSVLPGLNDLRGNAADQRFSTVFSTGSEFPNGVLRGVAFDWVAGRTAAGARIEATIGSDTVFKWATTADSSGRFSLGSLPAQRFTVRAWMDQNTNGIRDSRESWDSVTVTVSDSARNDLYMFPHDTVGARLGEVTVIDSVTIRIRFDRALSPADSLTVGQLRLVRARGADSTALRILSVMVAGQHDSVAIRSVTARADSMARADTSEKGRRALATADSLKRTQLRDSTAQAQIASIRAARDTATRVPPPVFGRPVPRSEFVIVTAVPLLEPDTLRLFARDVRALAGPARSTDRLLIRRKAALRDSTVKSARRPPPQGNR